MKKQSVITLLIFTATFFGTQLSSFATAQAAPGTMCTSPWGMPIMDGQFVTAYYEDRPTAGRRCQSEMRFCNNGFLSGFYRYQNCVEDRGCNEFPWGYIREYSSVTAYRNSIETGGRRCESETRYCSNGYLSGSFRNQSCTAM